MIVSEHNILEDRSSNILIAVVCNYISTAEPVGSRTIARKYDFGISPATIRNIMSDLEEMGFLVQPYTSAGRVPTDKGFRFYVDHLHSRRRLCDVEWSTIQKALYTETDLEHLMKKTTDLLSLLSNQVSLVLAHNLRSTICRHIDFIKLTDSQVLVIFVSEAGLVHKRVISIEEEVTQDQLDTMSKFLTSELMGLSLTKIRKKLVDIMETEKVHFDQLFTSAIKFSQQFFSEATDDSELYVSGTLNIMSQPEFADVEKMKTLFKAFEEKRLLIQILDKCMDDSGEIVKVIIGQESAVENMQDLSFVISSYKHGERSLGVIGVLGPKRMDYTQVIPIVEYTAKTMTTLLTGRMEF